MELTLKTDLYIGKKIYVVKGFRPFRKGTCPYCNGTGKIKIDGEMKICSSCEGLNLSFYKDRCLEYKVYEYIVEGFKYKQSKCDNLCHWYAKIDAIDYIQIDITPFKYEHINHNFSVFMEKREAEAEAEILNKHEKEK